jgi:endonuclease-3
MRRRIPAPVDTMGCDKLADRAANPRDQRFQTLVSLMLSSQTKDTVTSVTIRSLQDNLPGGLTLESILAVEPEKLNEMIWSVGFHNTKTKNIKLVAEILKEKFAGDIPDTIEGLMSLPGVGPKMGYLCLSSAWGRDEGIGVDVHVHRITNLWKWHQTKTPEETRVALQAWLPREKWHEINWLLVGFGQSICLPVGRKCGECTLAKKGLCPSVVGVKRVKREAKCEIKLDGELKDEVKIETETVEEFPMKEDVETAPELEDFGSTRRSPRRGRYSR